MSISLAIVEFLDQNYHYRLVAAQISHYAELAQVKILCHWELTQRHILQYKFKVNVFI
jgi:hypothetical protein